MLTLFPQRLLLTSILFYAICFGMLLIISPCIISAQSYTTSSDGRNYSGSSSYVPPLVTRTYTVPSSPAPRSSYTPPSYKYSGSTPSSNSSSGCNRNYNNNKSSSSYANLSSYDPAFYTPVESKKKERTSKYDFTSGFTDVVSIATLNGKSGLKDVNEKEIIPIFYDYIGSFIEGVADVRINGKWGYMNTAGKIVIPLKYDYVSNFYSAMAVVGLNKKETYIDKRGTELFPLKYEKLWFPLGGLKQVELNKKIEYIDIKGNELIPVKYDSVIFLEQDWKKMFLNEDYFFYEGKGKAMIHTYDWVGGYNKQGIAPVSINDKYGRVNLKGDRAIPVIYEDLCDTIYGMTGMKLNGKWGFLNSAAKVVIAPQFDSILLAFDKIGRAVVVKSGTRFYINRGGNKLPGVTKLPKPVVEISPWKLSPFAKDFDAVGDFENGLAQVNKNDKWGFIDKTRRVVIPIE